MVGGGSVFFHARSVGFAEKYWVNDKFKELVSFWRTSQDEELCSKLRNQLHALIERFESAEAIKEYFLAARTEEPDSDFREAFLFFFFNRVTFSGTTRAGGFSSSAALRRFTHSSVDRLEPMPRALEDTRISSGSFEPIIKAPGKDVFLFLDPPYFSARKLYGRAGSLHSFDHERLAALLSKTEHSFLITYDDCPEIRRLYRFAKVEKWQLQYGMNNCNSANTSKVGRELFISNYR